MATFNPNELALERIRSVEEYDPETRELTGRYTQIEDPELQLSADSTDVTDAMGSVIMTFYRASTGTFQFTNSLFSLDLAASQFGTTKEVADEDNPIIVPVAEVLNIGSDHTIQLTYTPVKQSEDDEDGTEVLFVKVLNDDNTFAETYDASQFTVETTETTDDDGNVVSSTTIITLPEEATGRAHVQYYKSSTEAVCVTKDSEGDPLVKSLLIHAIFHDVCNKNIVYAGEIYAPRAQIDPSSVDINFTPDGKHSASYILQSEYCDESGKIVQIFVSKD